MSDPSQTSFHRLHELFNHVSEMPADERDAEIARCAADAPALAEELRALLEQAARRETPLDLLDQSFFDVFEH